MRAGCNCAHASFDAVTQLQTYRERVGGRVPEIGFGSGLNLPYCNGPVEEIIAVDPPACSRCTVVVTWSLCSMIDVGWLLVEARRVLRPGGHLRFVEHGLSPDPKVGVWQHRLTRPWRRCAGGCHLNSKVDDLIRAAGFDQAEVSTDYALEPRVMTYMYEGVATVR